MPGKEIVVFQKEQVPAPDQRSIADTIFYNRLLHKIDEASLKYTTWKTSKSNTGQDTLSVEETQNYTKTALEDLYHAGKDRVKLAAFTKEWGEESEEFQGVLSRITSGMKNEKKEIEEKVSRFGTKDKIRTAVSISKELLHFTPDQRSRIFQMAGYSKEEAIKICKILVVSAGLTIAEYAAFAATYPAGLYGTVNPFFDGFDNTAKAAVALSYLAKYSVAVLNGWQNVKLLEEKSIQNSPNVMSTGTFYLLNKFLPQKKTLKNMATIFTPMAEPVIQDAALFLGMGAFPTGNLASGIIAKNFTGSGIGLFESTTKGVWLKVGKNKPKD